MFGGHLYQKNTWVSQKYLTYMYVKLVQMEVVQELHWTKQQCLLKVVPMSAENSIWHQVMGPCKELLWLVLQSMHHYHLDIFIRQKCGSSLFSWRGQIHGSDMARGPSCLDVGPMPFCLQSVACHQTLHHSIYVYLFSHNNLYILHTPN